MIDYIVCVKFSGVVHPEVTDDEIEKILAEEEANGALQTMFGSILMDDDDNLNADDIENEEIEDIGIVDEQIFTDLIESLKSDFNMRFEWNIMGVSCSAHGLQLGIKDGLKQIPKEHQNVIELCRQAAKFLRLKSTQYESNAQGIQYNLPRMDVETRWCYTFLMICI